MRGFSEWHKTKLQIKTNNHKHTTNNKFINQAENHRKEIVMSRLFKQQIMIFKLKFLDKIEFAQAKSVYDLQEKYSEEYGVDSWLEVILVTTIPDDEAKEIMLKNTDSSTFDECPEFSLYDTVVGDDFVIVGSTEWD